MTLDLDILSTNPGRATCQPVTLDLVSWYLSVLICENYCYRAAMSEAS